MRYIKLALAATIFILSFLSPASAGAISVGSPTGVIKTDSPVIITGYAHHGPALYYVQLFNTSEGVIDLSNWLLRYTLSSGQTVDVVGLSGLLKPGGYLVAGEMAIIPTADIGYRLILPEGTVGMISQLQLTPSAVYLDHIVQARIDAQHLHWKRATSSSTGAYLTNFTALTPHEAFILYGNGLYEYSTTTSLQVSEILANPRMCSPLETSGACLEYVKVYNPSVATVDLSQFRLRVGYKGQTSSSGNTFLLSGHIKPGEFTAITASSDGKPLTLSNSGAFVWLEDTYGMIMYDSTVIEYPDAGSDTKKGQAWAYDIADGTWKWTSQPTPSNTPSVFPVLPPPPVKPKVSTMPAPCKEGQYRSEETNRCRSVGTAATALAPCDDDEERNPATNRCRKLATLASAELTPCKPGQERNPETNRCRNSTISSPSDTAYDVEQVGEVGKTFIGWWALGGVGLLALGYALWDGVRRCWPVFKKWGHFLPRVNNVY